MSILSRGTCLPCASYGFFFVCFFSWMNISALSFMFLAPVPQTNHQSLSSLKFAEKNGENLGYSSFFPYSRKNDVSPGSTSPSPLGSSSINPWNNSILSRKQRLKATTEAGSKYATKNVNDDPDKNVDKSSTSPSSKTIDEIWDSPKGTRTMQVLDYISATSDGVGGAGGTLSREALSRMEEAWERVKTGVDNINPPQFVTETKQTLLSKTASSTSWDLSAKDDDKQRRSPEYDVVVCGGTIGIFVATALQAKGYRVLVIERGPLKGRSQEWNISKKEMLEILEAGILSEDDLNAAISIEFNPIRVGFKNSPQNFEFWTKDILNLGVSPEVLIERCKGHFLKFGGVIKEFTAVDGIEVAPDAASICTIDMNKKRNPSGEKVNVTSRLVLDCMGNNSPIMRQSRKACRPDGICIVVGSCSDGFDPEQNKSADLLYSASDITSRQGSNGEKLPGIQYFWEAFPAGSSPTERTTYMFAYLDAHPSRPSLSEVFEDYWELMPKYQNIKDGSMKSLDVKRVLGSFFPTYRKSPLKTSFDRICQIGDASGVQSPLSFGGFASLARHIHRLIDSFDEALQSNSLSKNDLGLINAYQPGLSSTWLFQRSMSVPTELKVKENAINGALIRNFESMSELGDPVVRPFLQDVVQAVPLGKAMLGILMKYPLSLPPILRHVGLKAFLWWNLHFIMLCFYTVMHNLFKSTRNLSFLSPKLRYRWNRTLDSFKFGAGLDYEL